MSNLGPQTGELAPSVPIEVALANVRAKGDVEVVQVMTYYDAALLAVHARNQRLEEALKECQAVQKDGA